MPDPFSLDKQSLPLPAQQQIDAVCIEFEDAWKSGERPGIEGFVARLPESLRAPLFGELLLVELDYRRRGGDTPSAEEYQQRFPGLENVVAAIFEKASAPETAGSTPFDQLADETPPLTSPWASGQPGPAPGKSLGRFELRERLGAGGFGTVYRAYDTMLRREVALKLPHPGRFESEEARARVLREARAAAQLYHPHIVPVYDAGTEGETFFIASAFVEGETLARSIEERRPDFREAATVVGKLATALEYAHRRGIIHRDVKPGNVMVASNGDPALMDFGLARFLESEDKLTHDGAVLGTPAYMSPEQARGQHELVGPASDQYSLGVVLYQLLCGDVPFTGTPAAVISDIGEKDPAAPRAVRPEVPRDLETICLKSLAKDPEQRYPSCRHLADDLGRWVRGEPIEARPIGIVGRAWRWCKRRPMVAGLSAALVLALVIGSGVSMVFGVQATRNARDLTVALVDLGRKKAEADTAKEQAEDERDRADKEKNLAQEERDRAEANFYINQIALARYQADQGNMAFAERLLDDCPTNLRHFEWGYLKRLCHLESMVMRDRPDPYGHVAVSPDGKRIASGVRDDAGFKGVVLWDAQTGEQVLRIELETEGPYNVALEADGLYDLDFSPDGRHVAAVLRRDDTARVWDAADGKEWLRVGEPGQEGAASVAFAPKGERLAVGGRAGTIWVYDLLAKKQLLAIATQSGKVQALQFSPDGKRIASEGQWIFQLWDAETGRAIRTIAQDTRRYGTNLGQEGNSALAFSPSGRRIATAAPTVAVWDAETGDQLLEIDATAGDLAFSPDGRHIAGTSSTMVKLWDSLTGEEVHRIFGRYASGKLAFLPDGKRLVTGGGKVSVWDLDQSQQVFDLDLSRLGGLGRGTTIAFHPERKAFAVGAMGAETAIYDTLTAEKVATLGQPLDHQAMAQMTQNVPQDELRRWYGSALTDSVALSFRADGMRMAEVCPDKTARIWGANSRSPIATIRSDGHLFAVAFSPDGQRVALVTEDTAVELWDVAKGERLRRFENQSFWGPGFNPGFRLPGFAKPVLPITGIAFRPDGRHVAVAVCTGGVKVWDAATGDEVYTLQTHPALKQSVPGDKPRRLFIPMEQMRLAYSHDSRQMATSSDAVIRLWDADTGAPLAALEGHAGRVTALAFSSDGKRLVSASQDNTVRIWDVPIGRELIRFEVPGQASSAVAISPDKRHVACWLFSSGSSTVKIWDAVEGDDLSFPRRSRSRELDGSWQTRSAYPLREATKESGPAPQPLSYQHLKQSGRDEITLHLRVHQQELTAPTVVSDVRSLLVSVAPFVSKSQERLGGEPAYVSDRVQYATFKVGNGPDPTFTLAIDPVPGEPPVIYFDQNNDEDLTSDGPGRWPDQFAGPEDRGRYVWNVAIDVPYATGTISQHFQFQLQCPVDAQRVGQLTWFLNASRECTVDSSGTQYTIVLVDMSTDGCFDDMKAGLIVRPDRGPAPFTGPRAPSVNDPFELSGEKWRVVRLSPDGTEMTLEPFRESAKRQPAAEKAETSSPHAEAEARIAAALQEEAEADFADLPLADVLEALAEKHQIPIELEGQALRDVGIGPDTPITFRLEHASLGTVLRLMLRQLHLTFLVREDVLRVTTPEAEERTLITRTYPLAGLFSPAILSKPDYIDFDSLIDLLTSKVAPSSWRDVGGSGSIKPGQLDGLAALTVQASYQVHEQVADCLEQLRREIARTPEQQAEAESRPPSTPPKPPPDIAAPDDHEMALEKALEAPVDLEFQDQPLSANVVPTLRKRFPINFVVDRRALVSAGIDPEAPISGTANRMPLDEALDKILDPHHLAWTVDEGVVLITTPQAADALLETRVYRAAEEALGGGGLEAAEAIISQITGSVAPDTWDRSGGPGSIHHVLLWPVHAFLVRQTYRVHRQLAAAEKLVPSRSGSPSHLESELSALPEALRAALARPVDLRLADGRLENAVETIQREQSIPLVIDRRALDDVGLRPDTKLTSDFEVTQLPLAQALTLLLRDLDLAWTAEEEVVTITTREEAGQAATFRTYALADLPIVPAKYDALVDSIESCVAPSSWDRVGGPGSIDLFRAGSVPPVLAVYNGQAVHRQVSGLMADLREALESGRRTARN